MKNRLIELMKIHGRTVCKYCVVGLSGCAIDVGGFALLIAYTPINRFLAASISFVAAVISNYTWHRVWTFKQRHLPITKQFVKFVLVSLGGLLLNLLFLWILSTLLAWILNQHPLPTSLQTLAKLGAVFFVFFYNFLINRHWTFAITS